jgi:hypothetical protein
MSDLPLLEVDQRVLLTWARARMAQPTGRLHLSFLREVHRTAMRQIRQVWWIAHQAYIHRWVKAVQAGAR